MRPRLASFPTSPLFSLILNSTSSSLPSHSCPRVLSLFGLLCLLPHHLVTPLSPPAVFPESLSHLSPPSLQSLQRGPPTPPAANGSVIPPHPAPPTTSTVRGGFGPVVVAGPLLPLWAFHERAPGRPVAQFRENHGLTGVEGEGAEPGRGLL